MQIECRMLHMDAEPVESLNLVNFEKLETWQDNRPGAYLETGTFSGNDVHHVAKNAKGILLYIFLACQPSGKLVGLVKF